MINRRRFLTLSAAFFCAPHLAQAQTWTGIALGAEVSVTLSGPRQLVQAQLRKIPDQLNRFEDRFSLYRAGSALSRLNRDGWLLPDSAFADIVKESDRAHRLTKGLFDPTVQPLWAALASGQDDGPARKLIDWQQVRWDSSGTLRIGRRQQLTFNGIAQGYITDYVCNDLKAAGFDHALINIGEYRAIGGPFRLGLSDPQHGLVGQKTLLGGAIATSSPHAMRLMGRDAHILGPQGQRPIWSTVSIEASSAAMADALSTAAVFMTKAQLYQMKSAADLTAITVVDHDGAVRSI